MAIASTTRLELGDEQVPLPRVAAATGYEREGRHARTLPAADDPGLYRRPSFLRPGALSSPGRRPSRHKPAPS
jgi:hypothetical protein